MKRFAIEKIEPPVPKRAQVYEQLKQAILYATFQPGEVLSIRNLAASLGTSTMPVREAATRLVTEQALELLPNRGLRVPTLTVVQAQDIYRVRFVLEGMATELAATHITAEEIRVLEGFQAKLDRAMQKMQVPEAVRTNIEFHLFLYRTSRSETLVALIEALYLRYAPSIYTIMRLLPGPNAKRTRYVHAHHAAILEALRNRDPKRARTALEKDLSDAINLEGFLKSAASAE